jgi:hypothetical protein
MTKPSQRTVFEKLFRRRMLVTVVWITERATVVRRRYPVGYLRTEWLSSSLGDLGALTLGWWRWRIRVSVAWRRLA